MLIAQILIQICQYIQFDQLKIMIRKLKILDDISHLLYKSETLPIINKYKSNKVSNLLNIINVSNPTHPPSIIGSIINSKKHSQLFLLYIQLICSRNKQSNFNPAISWIEQNLRKKVLNQINKQNLTLSINKCQVFESKELQRRSFLGVFIHRKYNLNIDSYIVNSTTSNHTSYQMKTILRSEAVREYQRAIQSFNKDSMNQFYGKKYHDFLTETKIVRYLYNMKVNLEIKTTYKGGEQIIGGKRPTEHLLQIQSFFNPVSNMEEFFLTDVDFILQGNHFLKEKI